MIYGSRTYIKHAAMLGIIGAFGEQRQPFNGNQQPPAKFENKKNPKKLGKYKLERRK